MNLLTYTTVLLLLAAAVLYARAGRARLAALIGTAALIWISLALLVGRAAADSFTGEGINEATLYHLAYGLRGAGWAEYRGVIVYGALALLLPAGVLIGLGWRTRRRPSRRAPLVGAAAIAGLSLATNPGARELTRLARPAAHEAADFYRYYRTPVITEQGPNHPNLLFIFAESFERTFFDESIFPGLVKELRALEPEAISFTDIQSAYGTGFTMGGMVAALCGVPLLTPSHPNSMSGMDTFLPGALGLSDVLHEQGYYLSYMGGAHSHFAGKGKFLQTHRFDEVLGFEQLHPRIPDRTYISNWGIYDDSLFELAFARLEELAREKRRFALFLLTLDTHTPNGHISRAAAGTRYGDGANPYLNAIAVSDRLIAHFVRRVRASPAGRNTVVVVASDHVAMNNTASELLRRGRRRNTLLVFRPGEHAGEQVARSGSTLDTGATVLPFLGYRGAIGLGRDLRDPSVPDAELAHIRDERTLQAWRRGIEKLWDFPRFREQLEFSAAGEASVRLDDRTFRVPVLAELHDNHRTSLRFEFDAAGEAKLAEQAGRLPKGTPFALVVKRDDARALLSANATVPESAWVLIVGKSGLGQTALPLTDKATVTRREVDAVLKRW